ncbi:hypothetical protein C0995_010258 [Termitomyces sp. Mi166|nr:hypothetical protein C0995_010258 [Termitomyces sp. Mi166\
MLVRWAVHRNVSRLRWDAFKMTSERAFYHAGLPPPGPATYYKTYRQVLPWTMKVWYQKDGKPRPWFKWTLYVKIKKASEEEADITLAYLRLSYLQHHGSGLSSLDTSDFQASLAQFRKLFYGGSVSNFFPVIVSFYFDEFRELTGSKREKVHAIVLEGLRKVHDILSAGEGEDPLNTGFKIRYQLAKFYLKMLEVAIKDGDQVSKEPDPPSEVSEDVSCTVIA